MADRQNTPSAELIREALEKIVSSQTFSTVPRQREILRFLVKEHLEGNDDVKAATIATEVFPKLSLRPDDNLARTEAGRIRKFLPIYYHSEGASDQLRITMAKERYALAFTLADTDPKPIEPNVQEAQKSKDDLDLAQNPAGGESSDEPPGQPVIQSPIPSPQPLVNAAAGRRELASALKMLKTSRWAALTCLLFILAAVFGIWGVWKHYKAQRLVEAQEYYKDGVGLEATHNPESIDRAIQKQQKALSLNPSHAGAPFELATIYLFDRDDYDLSLKYACLAIRNSVKAKDRVMEANAETLVSTLNRNHGHDNEALQGFKTALDVYVDKRDVRGMISAHNNLAVTYQDLGDDVNTIREHTIAIDLSKSIKDSDPVALSRSLRFRGTYKLQRALAMKDLLERERELGDAQKDLEDAASVIAGKQMPGDEAEAAVFIGDVHFEKARILSSRGVGQKAKAQEEWDKAEDSFREAIKQSASAPYREAQARNNLGNTYKLQKRWAAALEQYKLAFSVFEKRSKEGHPTATLVAAEPVELRREDVNVLLSIRDVCLSMPKPDYECAKQTCLDELRLVPGASRPHYDLACVYCRMGEGGKAAMAEFRMVKMNQFWDGLARRDSDLDCIRNNPEFIKMLNDGKVIPVEAPPPVTQEAPLTCPK